MKLKTTIFALFVITNLQNAYGEGNDSNGKSFYNIPTPNASELMKIGNIPVNCHTGSANISIPLYSYNYGGVPLDISLQYDATGLPMNRLPGWTGQGWTLIAGGSITRNKIGRPDDISYKGTQIRPKDQIAEHYFKNHSISTAYDGDAGPDMFYFNFLGKSGRFFLGSDGDWKVISDDIIDVQTDVSDESNYIYPFIQKIHLTNSEALAPVINYPKTIKGFTLVDGNGVQYTFGGGTGSIEYSSPLLQIHDLNYYKASETNPEGNPFVTPNMFWCADTWMLTDVKDRFGNSLYAFFYDRGKFIYQLSKNAYSPATKDYGALLKGDYTGVVNAPVYLCSIAINGGEKSIHFGSENAFPNEPASRTLYPSFYDNSGNPKWNTALPSHYPFLYAQSTQENVTPFHAYYPNVSTQTDPLSSMEIDLLKIIKADNEVSYSLHYDYNSRIHLSSVQMYEKSEILSGYVSGSIGEYKLLYYDYTNVPSDYLTDCIDYWGYCNSTSTVGKNLHRANQNQDPNTPLNPNPGTGGSENANTDGEKSFIYLWYNRPNINCGRKGMLSDIVYPTGGRTHFEYEQNTCSKYTIQKNGIFHVKAASDFEVAGLRIKRISNWENEYIENGTPLSSFNYDYNLEGRSSGDLYHIPNNCVDRYMQEPRLSLNDEIMHQERTGSAIIEYDYGASFGGNINSLTPLWDNRGPHMGYESVTVSDLEGNSKVHKYCGCMSRLSSTLEATSCIIESKHHKGIMDSELYLNKDGKTVKSVNYNYGVTGYIIQNAAYNQYGFVFGEAVKPTSNEGAFNQYTMCFPITAISSVEERDSLNKVWVDTKRSYKYDNYMVRLSAPFIHNVRFRTTSEEKVERNKDAITTKYEHFTDRQTADNNRNKAKAVNNPSTEAQETCAIVNNHFDLAVGTFFFPLESVTTSYNGNEIKRSVTEYSNQFIGTSLYLPKYEKEFVSGSSIPTLAVEYKEYESPGQRTVGLAGRLKKFVGNDGVETQLLWDRNGHLVGVAKNCEGTLTRVVNGQLGEITSSLPAEIFGSLPTDITVCNYKNGVITNITNGNSLTTYYNYDVIGRLLNVKNHKSETLQQYQYKYRQK